MRKKELFCGIDLHSNNSYLAISDANDRRIFHGRFRNDLELILAALEPSRKRLVAVAVESTYNWYWLVVSRSLSTRPRPHRRLTRTPNGWPQPIGPNQSRLGGRRSRTGVGRGHSVSWLPSRRVEWNVPSGPWRLRIDAIEFQLASAMG
jgi:hypothetical protein